MIQLIQVLLYTSALSILCAQNDPLGVCFLLSCSALHGVLYEHKSGKGQSLHRLKLLSPTENTAPETPRQQSCRQVCDFVTSCCVTMSHICIMYAEQLLFCSTINPKNNHEPKQKKRNMSQLNQINTDKTVLKVPELMWCVLSYHRMIKKRS